MLEEVKFRLSFKCGERDGWMKELLWDERGEREQKRQTGRAAGSERERKRGRV